MELTTEIPPALTSRSPHDRIGQARNEVHGFIDRHGDDRLRSLWHDEWEPRFRHLAEQIRKQPEVAISLVVGPGAGKSTLLNALIGARVLPVSNMRACTAAISEVGYAEGALPGTHRVSSPANRGSTKCTSCLADFRDNPTAGGGGTGPPTRAWTSPGPSATSSGPFTSPPRTPTPPGSTPSTGRSRPRSSAALDAGFIEIVSEDLDQFRKQIARYLDSKFRFWPIVKSVAVRGPCRCRGKVMVKSHATTAGRGDPYWYEWFVGVIEGVELPRAGLGRSIGGVPGTGVKGVGRRRGTAAGWGTPLLSSKHTRAEDTLTFGISSSWTTSKSHSSAPYSQLEVLGASMTARPAASCTRTGKTATGPRLPGGVRRPPLVAFMHWLAGSLPGATTMADLVPEEQWEDAWAEWCLLLSGSDADQLAFLRSLEIRTKQDDLEGLVERVTNAFASAFGVSAERVSPLVDALHRLCGSGRPARRSDCRRPVFRTGVEAEQKDLVTVP